MSNRSVSTGNEGGAGNAAASGLSLRPSDEDDASNAQIDNTFSFTTGVELISDDGGPPPPVILESSTEDESKSVTKNNVAGSVDIIDDDGPPTLLNDEAEAKSNAKKEVGVAGSVEIVDDVDGPPTLNQDSGESQNKKAATTTLPSNAEEQQRSNIPVSLPPFPQDRDIESPPELSPPGNDIESPPELSPPGNMDVELGTESSTENQNANIELGAESLAENHIIIPEATLVTQGDNENIVISGYAQPLLPWYKQKRTKILFSLICIVIVASAIAVGVSFSREPETKTVTKEVVLQTPPTVFPSSSPSTSFAPSSSPTMCSSKIYSGITKVALPLTFSRHPSIAVDGSRMVLVTTYDEASTKSTYVVFYSLDLSNGIWQRTNFIIESLSVYNVALSGKRALVGFYSWDASSRKDTGSVYIYEENTFGYWEEKGELLPVLGDRTGYGRSVGIDGNLACVMSGSGGFVYQHNLTSWGQIGSLPSGNQCLVKGHIIVVESISEIHIHKFNQDSGKIISPQDPLTSKKFVRGTALSGRHLAFFAGAYRYSSLAAEYQYIPEEILIYLRQDTNQNFTLQQTIVPSFYDGEPGRLEFDQTFLEVVKRFTNHLVVEDNLLVVGGYSQKDVTMPLLSSAQTMFFTEIDGSWEETLGLDLIYSNYYMSGRQLVATEKLEVDTFNVEACTQEVPTQMPSASVFPSESMHPTMKPTYQYTAFYTFRDTTGFDPPTQQPTPSSPTTSVEKPTTNPA